MTLNSTLVVTMVNAMLYTLSTIKIITSFVTLFQHEGEMQTAS